MRSAIGLNGISTSGPDRLQHLQTMDGRASSLAGRFLFMPNPLG